MNSFLFENYGYYPENFIDNSFFIEGWKYKLFRVDYLNDNQLEDIEKYIGYIRKKFNDIGPYLIKTRNGQNYSFYDGSKYALVCIYECDLQIHDLNKMHVLFKETNKKINLTNLLDLWNERINNIEKESINYLNYDNVNYKKNFEAAMFFLGMAVNASQYLSELIEDHGENIADLSLTHLRLNNLRSFEILNPFNLIIDHPIRDLAELYKKGIIEYHDFIDILVYYNVDSKIASLLMCRILYNYEVLDILSESKELNKTNNKLTLNLEKELMKVKKIYNYLKIKYNIRPIEWLEY